MENFSTSETALAAYLITRGLDLIDMDVSDPQRVYFIFEPKANIFTEGYWSGETAKAIELLTNYKTLKHRMYRRINDDRTKTS